MGGKESKIKEEALSENCQNMVMEVFAIFDKDGSKEIDKEEAVNHWNTKFGKLSAKELFDQVDFDGDGNITEEEFVRFWRIVKAAGHDEEEIMEELENIKNGETWAGFSDLNLKGKK